ncbi:hypothetical protein RvY_13995 [Ramazzottius varieornatus]|uniref:Zinc phosphodiesterase ELAC protein 2 n=1 Tax=Ramazzottius varieornatus TaxID=947166 RepID=A0A1D1VYB1_RAMVA|nr:hypothetical protein RvY_13995 [Ramazzottius varieornatus]
MTLLLRRTVFSSILPTFHSLQNASSDSSAKLRLLIQNMPKDPTTTLRHIKQRQCGLFLPPSEAFIQIVGDGTVGSPSCAVLVTSGSRYVFNCGEGVQRLIQEQKQRLSRVENVFFTTKEWKNIGGLPGLSLTIQDIGVPKLTLHGPSGISDIYDMTKRFLQVRAMEVEQRPLSALDYSDNNVSVQCIPLVAQVKGTPSSGAAKVCAYIGKIADKPGMLLMAKCVEHGVPPGPVLARLKDGFDVTLSDGRTVKASDVKLPDSLGPLFLVVECPSIEYLHALTENVVIASYHHEDLPEDQRIKVVVHFSPPGIMSDEKYQEWMNKFGNAMHLVANEINNNPNYFAPYRIQAMLNMLDDAIFPLLPDQRTTNEEPSLPQPTPSDQESSPAKISSRQAVSQVFQARPRTNFYLRPAKGLDSSLNFTLNNEEFRQEAFAQESSEGLEEALQEYRKRYPSRPFIEDFTEPDITFLGTGSAIPSKVRNTSGVLLRLHKGCSMLLDCGEGSAGQLIRFFGVEKTREELLRLKAVYLSHPHADHHIGFIELLRQRRKCFELAGASVEPLIVFTPEPMISYFEAYSKEFEPILRDIQIFGCSAWHHSSVSAKEKEEALGKLSLRELNIFPVVHCPFSFGVSLTSANWKMCYSGDTMPCEALVKAGMGSDLLIHEATMEDSLEDEARKKMHSTTSQAIETGRRMHAKFTLLTHFSQRYAKIPLLTSLPTDVGIAFDNMRVRLSDLPKIPSMLPALQLMFSEHVEGMQNRSERHERRRKWLKVNDSSAGDAAEPEVPSKASVTL